MNCSFVKTLLTLAALACAAPATANPYADAVVSYDAGAGVGADFVTGDPFSDPTTALGEPTRFTSDPNNFGGAVTPFQSPFRADEVVSIGEGGWLEVAFDTPVTDDPNNPYGIDLLIFGNSFMGIDFTTFLATGPTFGEGGLVEVSADGVTYVPVTGVDADGVFPTLGYQDLTDAFPTTAGAVPTDFTLPVDPSFDPTGMTPEEVYAAYGGSGGGAGVDLAPLGLSEISFVRISNPVGSGVTPEIDGFADVRAVPEPAAGLLAALAFGLAARRRRS